VHVRRSLARRDVRDAHVQRPVRGARDVRRGQVQLPRGVEGGGLRDAGVPECVQRRGARQLYRWRLRVRRGLAVARSRLLVQRRVPRQQRLRERALHPRLEAAVPHPGAGEEEARRGAQEVVRRRNRLRALTVYYLRPWLPCQKQLIKVLLRSIRKARCDTSLLVNSVTYLSLLSFLTVFFK
jgi:hypothetical protein